QARLQGLREAARLAGEPGVEQRQPLDDVAAGLAGCGGAPVEQDLGDDGVHARVQPRTYLLGEYSWSILPAMSVPLTLLGLLERGPSHGYDLKRDYDAYFGRGRPLRYSQVYATLSRLARDGKAIPGPVEQGAGPERRRYLITEAG